MNLFIVVEGDPQSRTHIHQSGAITGGRAYGAVGIPVRNWFSHWRPVNLSSLLETFPSERVLGIANGISEATSSPPCIRDLSESKEARVRKHQQQEWPTSSLGK